MARLVNDPVAKPAAAREPVPDDAEGCVICPVIGRASPANGESVADIAPV